MGDPIDPETGYPDVTYRFNQDIEDAFFQFCGESYAFGQYVNNYGSLLNGLVSFPADFMSYMDYFVSQVKTGGSWDLKFEGNGYSIDELGGNDKQLF
jgi:hypothetical protein